MTALLLDRCWAVTATTGTGTVTLGAAISPAFQSWASAGAQNGSTYYYLITDGTNQEWGTGVYTSSGTTLTRSVIGSIISGVSGTTPITLSGSASVACVETAASFLNLPPAATTTTPSSSDNSTKIATTQYVTTAIANAIAGVNPAVAVQAATTSASDTSGLTYNNGASGIGATFIGSINTALTVDGFTFTAVGQRLLVKNDTQSPSGAFNGIYSVTQIQTSLLPPILTRATDYNQPSEINETGAVPVINGTANAETSWLLTSTVNTVGTDPLTYVQFSVAPANTLQTGGANPTNHGVLLGKGTNVAGSTAAGTAGQVLTSNGGSADPTFQAPFPPRVIAHLHANSSIPNSTFGTSFSWAMADIIEDDLSTWSSGSPTKFSVPTGYTKARITISATWAANNTGARWVFALNTSGAVVLEDTRLAISETACGLVGPWVTGLVPGTDFISFEFAQTSGGNLNLTGATGYPATVCQIEWAP